MFLLGLFVRMVWYGMVEVCEGAPVAVSGVRLACHTGRGDSVVRCDLHLMPSKERESTYRPSPSRSLAPSLPRSLPPSNLAYFSYLAANV